MSHHQKRYMHRWNDQLGEVESRLFEAGERHDATWSESLNAVRPDLAEHEDFQEERKLYAPKKSRVAKQKAEPAKDENGTEEKETSVAELETLSAAKLRAICVEAGLEVDINMSKDDLIKLLTEE
jgi:hypothetical protein